MLKSSTMAAMAAAGLLWSDVLGGNAGAQAPVSAAFEKLDVNEDGVLSGAELKSVAPRDADGDGRVTRAEFEERAGGGPAPGNGNDAAAAADDERLFARRDITEDGVLSGTEAKGFETLDADGDREVTKAEFLRGRAAARGATPAPGAGADATGGAAAARIRAEALFLAADGNRDGRLSGTELTFDLKTYDGDGDGRITQAEFLDVETAKLATPHETASLGITLFLEAIRTGDSGPFYAIMREELRREIDERIFRWVIEAMHKEYGQVAKMEKMTSKESKTPGKPYELLVDVSFAKGNDTGALKVIMYGGLLLGFRLQTPLADRIDAELYGRLASDKEFALEAGEYFAPRGRELFELMFAKKDEAAHGLFHPDFQAKVPLETMQGYLEGFRTEAGKVKSIEWSSVTCKFGEGGKPESRFSVDFDIEAENGKFTGHARYEFAGFKAVLIGIGFEKAEP
jgi:Ca2+-binding EF-hand superfamily protein